MSLFAKAKKAAPAKPTKGKEEKVRLPCSIFKTFFS